MYRYDERDATIVQERVAQFSDQVKRRIAGELGENAFKPLRLQNGLYMQLHAYMLRVAIPYGLLSSRQLRKLAEIARKYDRGYGHFTTRQNIQYNWPKLEDVPKILAELASVEMHAVQTSGNCIRNTTSDQLAGVAPDEIEDPRPYCEIIRQWSTFHPEFAFLPRKFKIAVTGSATNDRAAIRFHDIGLELVKNDAGTIGFAVYVGGGMGRTPKVAPCIHPLVEKRDLLSYLEAILRVYNLHGRRDNKYKARIKILVDAVGPDKFAEMVAAEWEETRSSGLELTDDELERVSAQFRTYPYADLDDASQLIDGLRMSSDRALGRWAANNVVAHKQPGYSAVYLSLKRPGLPPGDCTDEQMEAIADLADEYSMGELVVTHEQNLVFPNVESRRLEELWSKLAALNLADPNIFKATDIICCPGLDYCNLANARSIPVAAQLTDRFNDFDYLHDVGDITLNISGCINACGHHHVGNLGILGINKQGEEFYQLTLGGSAGTDAAIGKIIGPAFPANEIVGAVAKVLETYLAIRDSADENFLECYRRVGPQPFKDELYVN